MSPLWYAAGVGVRRGWTELRQTLTTGQDVFGYVLWTVMLLVPLFLLKDDPLKGAGISTGAFMLPSMMGMTLAFTGMMTTAQLLATEREDGTLLRAKAVPHGMVGHLVGKIIMVSGTALLSMALPFAVGMFLVDGVARQGGGALLTLVWVMPLGLLATLPIGAVIGSLVSSPRTVGLLMLPVMGLIVISGIYFPPVRAAPVAADRRADLPRVLARPRSPLGAAAGRCGRRRDRRVLAAPGDSGRAGRLGSRRAAPRTIRPAQDGPPRVRGRDGGTAPEGDAAGRLVMCRGCQPGSWSGRVGQRASAPADALLAADAGAFLALGGEHVGVAGVRVAPAQVAVRGPGLRRVVRIVGVGQGELPQRAEVRLDGLAQEA